MPARSRSRPPTPKGTFTGGIENVVVDIDPEAYYDPDLIVRARYRKQ